MNRDHEPAAPQSAAERTRLAAHPIDDDIAKLVRDVAGAWEMPAVRLDQPTWRDRVRSPRSRRLSGIGRGLERLGQAGMSALVLTIAAALVAVLLTNPRSAGPAQATGSTSAPSPAASGGAAASPLAKLLANGPIPSPSHVVVQNEAGQYAIVDLATGTLGSQLTTSSWGSRLAQAPNGDLLCVCTSTDGSVDGAFTHVRVSLDRFSASGAVLSRTEILDVTGSPDPRYGAIPQQPGHVSTFTTITSNGRFAYVGWSSREHPVWASGIVMVFLGDGTVVQRLDLPSRGDGVSDTGVYVDAPRVVGEAGDRLVIDRPFYTWTPVLAAEPSFNPGSDVFTTTLANGSLGTPVPLDAAAGCGSDVNLAGPLPGSRLWLSCSSGGGSGATTIRRVDAGGSVLGDTAVSLTTIDGSTSAISPDGSVLYLWNPVALELTRVDLATGNTTKAKAPAASAATEPLTALGRWLAPAALGKTFLDPGIAISPDGRRVYAIGILGNPAAADFTGSAGIVVFDTDAMTALGRWAPTADFVSVAMSADGSLVYAAGAAGLDAAGNRTGQPASITVFNAGDGSIRLVAGQLGRQLLSFTSATLR